MLLYKLTPSAEVDLKEIAMYTKKEWGAEQARIYGESLENGLSDIAYGYTAPRIISERYKEVFFTRCEHHYIFYLRPKGEVPLIIAVLHERMDFLARLKERLEISL